MWVCVGRGKGGGGAASLLPWGPSVPVTMDAMVSSPSVARNTLLCPLLAARGSLLLVEGWLSASAPWPVGSAGGVGWPGHAR
jgi:hypothetical protein